MFVFCLCFFLLMLGNKRMEVSPSILALSFRFPIYCCGFISLSHQSFLGPRVCQTTQFGLIPYSCPEPPSRAVGAANLFPHTVSKHSGSSTSYIHSSTTILFVHLFSNNGFCLAFGLSSCRGSLLITKDRIWPQFAYCLIFSLLRA